MSINFTAHTHTTKFGLIDFLGGGGGRIFDLGLFNKKCLLKIYF